MTSSRPFHRTMRFHQRLAFSSLFCRVVGADGTVGAKRGRAKRVFFPGCSLSAYSPGHVLAAWQYLRERMEGVGALLKCCGKPLKLMTITGELDRKAHV